MLFVYFHCISKLFFLQNLLNLLLGTSIHVNIFEIHFFYYRKTVAILFVNHIWVILKQVTVKKGCLSLVTFVTYSWKTTKFSSLTQKKPCKENFIITSKANTSFPNYIENNEGNVHELNKLNFIILNKIYVWKSSGKSK